MRVLKAVEEVNENQKMLLFNKLSRYFKGELKVRRLLYGDWPLSPKLMICVKLLHLS